MTAQQSMASQLAFTEFEEGIAFDQDDPDFVNGNLPSRNNSYLVGPTTCRSYSNAGRRMANTVIVSSPMSIARVETMRMLNKSHSLSLSSISSIDDAHLSFSVANSVNSTSSSTQEPVVSIEELRLQLNSCFTCGVSWHEDHVSLDCQECGGYSLERPCPRCDGRCGGTWKRDLTMSHASGKARWEGTCHLSTSTQMLKNLVAEDESHLCSRLEKLTASS